MYYLKVHTLKDGHPCYINTEYIISFTPAYDATGKVSGTYIFSFGSMDEILCKESVAEIFEQI